jgi:hypothetical protein
MQEISCYCASISSTTNEIGLPTKSMACIPVPLMVICTQSGLVVVITISRTPSFPSATTARGKPGELPPETQSETLDLFCPTTISSGVLGTPPDKYSAASLERCPGIAHSPTQTLTAPARLQPAERVRLRELPARGSHCDLQAGNNQRGGHGSTSQHLIGLVIQEANYPFKSLKACSISRLASSVGTDSGNRGGPP